VSIPAPQSVRVDQMLHGYDRGHKELASSLRLDEASRATMLVYSDVLADLGDGPCASYLTCYPLSSASRHVLARTWPAGAGFRPGSVWTHSLVLDYQALALLPDLVALEPLLMGPGDFRRGRPVKSILLPAGLTSESPLELAPNAAAAVNVLYGRHGGGTAVPALGGRENDLLSLALWRQMWPSLRREFTFTTGVGAGRPSGGAEWMLRFANAAANSAAGGLDAGTRALLDDLPAPGRTPLRQFLGRYAVESPDPRRIAAPLAELWSMPAVGFEERLRAARSLTVDVPLPRLTRDLVSAELDAAPGPAALFAVVREFGDQPLDVEPSHVVRLGDAMDAGSLRQLLSSASAASSGRLGNRVFEAAVRGCDLDRLAGASQAGYAAAMLLLRPELLDVAEFWPGDDGARAALIGEHAGRIGIEKGWALFGDGVGPLTAQALLDGDPDPPAVALLRLLSQGSPQVAQLAAMRTMATPSSAEAVLESGDCDRAALGRLADALVASAGPPPNPSAWCAAVRRVRSDAAGPTVLAAGYVASLALGGDEGLRSARQVCDRLQRLVRRYELSRETGRYLEAALPRGDRGWSLAESLTNSALSRWRPGKASAGALVLSTEHNHFRGLVDGAFDRFGRPALREALLDAELPDCVRAYAERRLEAKPGKSWWF